MTTEQRKTVTERLAKIEEKERGLWADLNEVKAKKEAISNEWLAVNNEAEWLKKFIAMPEEPALAT